MALITPVIRALNGGLWSPRMFGRHDLDVYQKALSKCENFIPTVGGSARKRGGTIFAGLTKDVFSGPVRVIPFVFSATDASTIELGHNYVRFWKDGALTEVGGVPLELATPWQADELEDIDYAQDADTICIVHRNHPPQLLQRFADTDWRITELDPTYGPYLGRGEILPGIVATSTVFNVDTPVWLTYDSTKPTGNDMRIESPIWSGNFIARSGSGFGAATVTGLFDANRDIGRLIMLNAFDATGNAGGTMDDLIDTELAFPVWGRITAVPDTATLTIELYDGWWPEITSARIDISTQMWFMDAFFESADATIKEWPQTCTFFEERLFLGASPLAPDLMHGSRTGTLKDFDLLSASDAPPAIPATDGGAAGVVTRFQLPNPQAEVLATSGISLGISGSEVAEIQWIRPIGSSLMAGTTRSVYQLSAVGENKIFGPTEAISSRPTNAIGSTRIGAIALRDRLYFLLPSEERLFMLNYRLQSDSYIAQEVSLFNPDILSSGVKDSASSVDPEPIYWTATRNNTLAGITIDTEQQVFAFHEHVIAGTDVQIESVCSIPDLDDGEDQVWLVVSRTVNGATVRSMEYIHVPFKKGDDKRTQHFVDAGVIDFSATTAISGLSHLEGETVAVLGDGAYIGDFEVTAGAITIPRVYVEVHAGLLYDSEVNSVPIVVNDPQGSSFGKKQRASSVTMYLVRTIGGEVAAGPSDGLRWRPINMRTGASPIGEALEPETGIQQAGVEGENTRSLVVGFRHRAPFNAEIAAMGVAMDSSSR